MAPKYYTGAFLKFKAAKGLAKKLKHITMAGSRIAPSQTNKNDSDFQLRIDAGEMIGTKLNVYLQVNAQATGTLFKEWLRKKGTHANLATAVFDTAAQDEEEEKNRVLEELEAKGAEVLANL